jgi:integrase
MRKLNRYQNGSLEEIKTAAGICWYIRFTDAQGRRPRFRIGLKSQFATEAKASRAAQHIRDQFNDPSEALLAVTRTFGDVIARYEAEEMPKQHSTARGYRQIHRNHIEPRWGSQPLADMKAMDVRKWLQQLDLATKTKGNIVGQMRSLFRFAMLWEWIPAAINTMDLFTIPGVSKRTRKPRVISPAQFRELLLAKPILIRTMLIGAYCLGLRVSELFGLQWGDFNFLESKVWIRRGVVEGRTGKVKTERSEAPLPLAKPVLDAFLEYYATVALKGETEWVFASRYKAGRLPIDSRNIQTKHLVGAGKAIGLDFSLGWHTFRHSYKVLLERAGVDLTVQRDLMRHADTHTTSQIYGEVEFDRMRTANDAAVALALASTSAR